MTRRRQLLTAGLAVLCGLALVSCASVPPLVKVQAVEEVSSTNLVTGEVLVERATNHLWIVNPAWSSGIDLASSANRIANPTPFSPLVELGLLGLSAVLAALARKKNTEAKQSAAQAKELDQVLDAIVEGVEKSQSETAKRAIELEAVRLGVNHTLHRKVSNHEN